MIEATLIRKMTELRDDLCVKDGHLNGVRAQGVNRAIFIIRAAFAAERKRSARSATKAIRGGGR